MCSESNGLSVAASPILLIRVFKFSAELITTDKITVQKCFSGNHRHNPRRHCHLIFICFEYNQAKNVRKIKEKAQKS